MKNITIKIEADVAHWTKVWAAEHNTSVSRILGDLLKQKKQQKTGYSKAMQQFLKVDAQPLKTSKGYPLRDDLHGRSRSICLFLVGYFGDYRRMIS